MITVKATISGSGSTDEVVNDAREAVARAGFQVGNFQETTEFEHGMIGNLEVDDRLFQHLADSKSGWTKFEYGNTAVELEVR